MPANDRLRDQRILVVDDDKDTREMLRFVLQQEGGHVIAAGSVAEAFESYKNSAPDVIVSDIGMPDYNGYALIALFLHLFNRLIIIVITKITIMHQFCSLKLLVLLYLGTTPLANHDRLGWFLWLGRFCYLLLAFQLSNFTLVLSNI